MAQCTRANRAFLFCCSWLDDHHRGFGFVEYELADDAKAAIDNMHLSELYGKTIKCSIAKPSKIGELTGGSSKTRASKEQSFYVCVEQEPKSDTPFLFSLVLVAHGLATQLFLYSSLGAR